MIQQINNSAVRYLEEHNMDILFIKKSIPKVQEKAK